MRTMEIIGPILKKKSIYSKYSIKDVYITVERQGTISLTRDIVSKISEYWKDVVLPKFSIKGCHIHYEKQLVRANPDIAGSLGMRITVGLPTTELIKQERIRNMCFLLKERMVTIIDEKEFGSLEGTIEASKMNRTGLKDELLKFSIGIRKGKKHMYNKFDAFMLLANKAVMIFCKGSEVKEVGTKRQRISHETLAPTNYFEDDFEEVVI